MSKTFEIMLACLLCDFGVIFSRAAKEPGAPTYFENKLPGDVLEALFMQRGPLAGIVQAARRVADPCPSTQAVPTGMALESIFNRLNGRNGRARLSAAWPEDTVQYPSEGIRNDEAAYRELLSRWAHAECDGLYEPDRANALMALLERCLSGVPAARYDGERCDVSLHHLNRATAAIGCCMERWMSAKGISDPQQALSPDEKPFLLYSLDMSGIQSFIYTISNKGALKGLRARSFYLSMLMEHIADSVLEACGLYRANLIYAGGGRAQILLPNDGQCVRRADEVVRQVNAFLLERFGASLFLASGSAEASAAALSSVDDGPRRFSDVFREASRVISRQKLQRYGADTLLTLNRMDAGHGDDRECVVCGRGGHLRPHGEDGDMICEVCGALEAFSNALTWDDDILLAVSAVECANALPLPGGLWLSRAEDSVPATRFYHINGGFDGRPKTIWLHIGNYCAANGDNTTMTFDELAAASAGVARLGVLRADVDSLGALFASGFICRDAKNPHKYVTLPRYMALSAALTAFFQREINRLVRQGGKTWLPEQAVSENRNVTIVYAGGDDVFLVGAWNEVLDAGLSLRAAFSKYTGGGVTLSAG
ncbi:MAG: type III-A CRISPR-associated protein Cas10/Csm1, partial [bacterium]